MTTIINASPTNGLQMTSDGSGIAKLQSNGVTTNALAWVNFNGGTGTIQTAYNVSSVTRTATGTYTINLASVLADAKYVVAATAGNAIAPPTGGTAYPVVTVNNTAITPTAGGFGILTTHASTGVTWDMSWVGVAVFGN